MFNDPSLLPGAIKQRRSTARTSQADLWSAGIGVTVPGGHPLQPGWDFPRVTAGTDIEQFVADRIAEGSDYVKVILENGGPSPRPPLPTLTPDQFRRTIIAAHRHRRRAVVHAEKLQLALSAVRSGADGLVHAFWDTAAGPAEIREIQQRRLRRADAVGRGLGNQRQGTPRRRTGRALAQRHAAVPVATAAGGPAGQTRLPEDRFGQRRPGAARGRCADPGLGPTRRSAPTPTASACWPRWPIWSVPGSTRARRWPRRPRYRPRVRTCRPRPHRPGPARRPGARGRLDPTTDITDLRAIKAVWRTGTSSTAHHRRSRSGASAPPARRTCCVPPRGVPHRAASGSTTTTSLPRVCSSARFW